jgi:hypothetical protein
MLNRNGPSGYLFFVLDLGGKTFNPSKDDIQILPKEYMKRCSTFAIIRK